MDVKRLQQRLGCTPDGILGAQTYRALFDHMARRPLGVRGDALAKGALNYFARYGVTTELRLAHFMAQATHETGDFCYMRELWGPTPAQRKYEGRKDLGNTQPGDGRLFAGRGIFQTTGRANYEEAEIETGLPLLTEPDLAAQPDNAVWLACLYWQSRHLSALADADDILAITKKINGGTNGLLGRKSCLARAKGVLT